MSTISNCLAALRELTQEYQLDAYLIPDSDPHSSEYLADHRQGRRWISGFTGTAGSVVITQDKAGLWTDGHYYIQAEEQLAGSGITPFRAVDPSVPDWNQWLQQIDS